jgi:hypothetical protein
MCVRVLCVHIYYTHTHKHTHTHTSIHINYTFRIYFLIMPLRCEGSCQAAPTLHRLTAPRPPAARCSRAHAVVYLE